MPDEKFADLIAEIHATRLVQEIGRVEGVSQETIIVRGLTGKASVGDQISIGCSDGNEIGGEVLNICAQSLTILPDGATDGIVMGDPVLLIGKSTISPTDDWVGRIVDPNGTPLDGNRISKGSVAISLKSPPPNPAQRRPMGERLETGLAVFNTFLPIVRGQRLGLFSGSGVGKSTLISKLAKGVQADVVVVALIGERGREVREFVDKVLGPEGMKRAVVVAATSDRSPLIRRKCAFTAIAVAEYFRDQGMHVLILADSITRFAEAHREVALAAGEQANLRGFPASISSTIMGLCERAGPGIDLSGDITAIFTVLVAGSDMEEPIADILRGVLDGHVILDRAIAERGRFPAIDLLRSVSRSLPAAATNRENDLINRARNLLGTFDRAEMMIQAGLYSSGSDEGIDEAIKIWPALDAFSAEEESANTNASFKRLSSLLSTERALE